MVRIIVPDKDVRHFGDAIAQLKSAKGVAAFTGAGISVESGIPDFRSPGGLWTLFPPEEYAGIHVFLTDPVKAWKLYRAMGRSIEGRKPNAAHRALADLEKGGFLDFVVTQNVDGLHQAAGSEKVFEIHGDHGRLQCLDCGRLEPVMPSHLEEGDLPECPVCRRPLKPNVVLFGEGVREMDAVAASLEECELLLVVGTSAKVYPAAGIPQIVKSKQGLIYEFNREETSLTRGSVFGMSFAAQTDFFFKGSAGVTLEMLAEAVLE